MPTCSLIDLTTTPLRDYATEEDFQYMLTHKERWFALGAVFLLPRMVPVDNNVGLEHQFVLIHQRQPSPHDMHEGIEHARDLPITGSAYQDLRLRVRAYTESGQYKLPPDWRERFPDIADFYDKGRVPNVADYPAPEC